MTKHLFRKQQIHFIKCLILMLVNCYSLRELFPNQTWFWDHWVSSPPSITYPFFPFSFLLLPSFPPVPSSFFHLSLLSFVHLSHSSPSPFTLPFPALPSFLLPNFLIFTHFPQFKPYICSFYLPSIPLWTPSPSVIPKSPSLPSPIPLFFSEPPLSPLFLSPFFCKSPSFPPL